jgi:adenylate kinase
VIIIVGLPGAGKTSVLNELKKMKNLEIVNFGDLISEIAIKKGLVKNRDELNYVPVKIHRELQKTVAKKIKQLDKKARKNKKILIIDTHALLKKKEGFFPGISPELLKEKIEGFIFIDAPSEEIIERRKTDKTRTREIVSKDEIDKHRFLSICFLSSYSSQTGAPLFIVENRNNRLEEAVKQISEIINYIG